VRVSNLENFSEKLAILQAVWKGLNATGRWRLGAEKTINGVAVGQD